MKLKPVQVRLAPDAFRALRAYAAVHHLTLGGAAAALMQDQILGRARGLPDAADYDRGGFVYVIRVGERCKIGKAKDLKTRIRSLHLPSVPKVIAEKYSDDPLELERVLHDKFKHLRERGEWFRLGASEIDMARTLLGVR